MSRQTVSAASAGHVAEDQSEAMALLADPATHGLAEPVKRIDTHAAAVFLAGPDVYKLKRAVKFPFMDLSTAERRRAACEAEAAVSSRYAPDLYLGVLPIAREDGRRLRLGGNGEAVDWVVHLRRFDETMTLDLVAERGELHPGIIACLARVVAATYADAEVRDGTRATKALAGVVEETCASLIEAQAVFHPGDAAALRMAMTVEFDRLRPLLLRRGADGKVRRCHGDLHLRNIVLIGGKPTLFDAIEFDESIATIDVLYDFAFLLMDLWERGFKAEANLLLNRYLWSAPDLPGELAGLVTLPVFLALRAAVRAKVAALRYADVSASEECLTEARGYLAAARTFIAGAPARLVAVGGLSGTGKSTLAARIAPAIGRAPGAVHLRSDIERKREFGVPELTRLPDSAYSLPVTGRVFAALRDQAAIALRAGHSVIVDAVHLKPEERALIAVVAERAGVPFTGLWLEAPLEVLIERVTARTGDASDALANVVAMQAKVPPGSIDWIRLDASGTIEALTDAAIAAIGVTPAL